MKTGRINNYLLPAIIIIIGGFILFNFAFILTALVIRAIMLVMRTPENMPPPFFGRFVALFLILLISWLVFRSRINHTIKATVLTMPLMTILVLSGLFLYSMPQWTVYLAGAAIILAVLFFLYKKKLPWVYYFATLFVAALGIFIMATGMDI